MYEYKIIIDGDPVGKSRPRFARGHAYSPQKNREYEKMINKSYDGLKLEGAVNLRLTAYYQKPKKCKTLYPTKKPDIDNVAKIIMDSLNGVAYDDDKQVINLSIVKRWTDDYPRVEITISEVVE
ncbi:MAG: RusA family crossover junction endodeoxyribonuclease [Lachnospiraceae bacterium]|nr:RusA family crossover junction endodeoxyribonuclease [Lachnospiraceae bacterium]